MNSKVSLSWPMLAALIVGAGILGDKLNVWGMLGGIFKKG